jgi:iron complex transport system ATP-binding protein
MSKPGLPRNEDRSAQHEAAPMSSAILRINALDVAYGSRHVLSQLRLAEVQPGSVVGVLGPNGVGKSTLLRAIARLVPAHGEVRLGTLDLLACRRLEHLRHVAYLPQTLPQGSSLRVLEVIVGALRATCPNLAAGERDERLQSVLDGLHLMPLALRRLDQLSGGQRQMVGLAQVLVRRAPLMLLDEPTSALDLRWQMHTLRALREAARERGAVVCLAMHDLNLAARSCDRLVLLGAGGLLADGTPVEVLRPELLREAFQVDARIERVGGQAPIVLVDRAVG